MLLPVLATFFLYIFQSHYGLIFFVISIPIGFSDVLRPISVNFLFISIPIGFSDAA